MDCGLDLNTFKRTTAFWGREARARAPGQRGRAGEGGKASARDKGQPKEGERERARERDLTTLPRGLAHRARPCKGHDSTPIYRPWLFLPTVDGLGPFWGVAASLSHGGTAHASPPLLASLHFLDLIGITSMGIIMGLGVWMASARSQSCLFWLPPLLLLRLLLQRLAHSADTLLEYRKKKQALQNLMTLLSLYGPPWCSGIQCDGSLAAARSAGPLGRGFWATVGPRARQVDFDTYRRLAGAGWFD